MKKKNFVSLIDVYKRQILMGGHSKVLERQWEVEEKRRRMMDAMAHDLKTPLGIIKNYGEVLLEEQNPQKRERYVKTIIEESDSMNEAAVSYTHLKEQLNSYVREAQNLYDLPGLAVSVEVGENGPAALAGLNCKEAVGVSDVDTKEPLLPEHIFHMASVSKLFTSAGILTLCREGRLNLEDRLCDVLPEISICDDRMSQIRVRHMLTHTSGMADVEDYCWDSPRTDADALKD